MQPHLLIAAILMVLIGAIHSVLGEILIFQRLRKNGWIPTEGAPILKESHVRILWATWHLGSVFGWGMACLLFQMAHQPSETGTEGVIALSSALAGLLVLVGTHGRHPGWVGLLAVALLIWLF
ncbi:hypothetical protein [Deinococcus cellulosilyticus]|uniref:Uncharacterized protein n=1 Tax=Deinococcus cellulosilyticus (strain DSM 18568 / NBRC 106333 / KACC 11606 / 5516J-15) TaxID=1223518 RepID=A0A511MV01_DEIC1|nr:hypothetical protein [Deinococcus cellulosilyticus]GEM44412.1 hypothetical protein DC3_00470 [Deinococcus cellulosilyticus NBRC 106333 = KACC 11606]